MLAPASRSGFRKAESRLLPRRKDAQAGQRDGLSPAQWNFKPAPDRWSIAQIAEHILLSEDFLFDRARQMLKSPALPASTPRADRAQDERDYAQVTDRSRKFKSPPELQPPGRWPSPAALAQAFRQRRNRTIRYVETTQDDLRGHRSGSGADAQDAYEVLVMIAAHTERHLAQINEVKADPRYPK